MRTIIVFIRQLKTIHTTQVTIFSCWTTVTHVWCRLIPAACFSKLGLLIDATLPSIAWWRLVHVRYVHIILLSSTLGYIYLFTLNPHRLTLPLWFCLFYSFNTLLHSTHPSWAIDDFITVDYINRLASIFYSIYIACDVMIIPFLFVASTLFPCLIAWVIKKFKKYL